MVEPTSHDDLVREQFSRQADGWDSYVTSGYDEDVLRWIVSNLELTADLRALDVAAGTGLVARALAPWVKEAVAADATPEMVAQGRQLARSEGLANVTFDEADARNLPYSDAAFDLVACRLAMHHFEDPDQVLREMVRVCRPGGQVAVIDITTSEDPEAAQCHNRLEQLRDPSHTAALPPSRLRDLVTGCGLNLVSASFLDSRRQLEEWMGWTQTPDAAHQEIAGRLQRQLAEGPDTGMKPSREEGELMFSHCWLMLVARKP